MKSSATMIIVLTCAIGCNDAAKPKPPTTSATAIAIVNALAARKDPVLELAAPSSEPFGRCGARFDAPTDADLATVLTTFEARNPGRWSSLAGKTGLDPWLGNIGLQRSPTNGTPTATPLDEIAAQFLVKNYELFGITRDNLADIKLAIGPSALAPDAKEVTATSTLPQPGFERFSSVASDVKLRITIGPDGEVRSITGYARTLPKFAMCTDPELTADAIKTALIGHELVGYDPSVDEPSPAGHLDAANIGAIDPTILVRRNPEDGIELRLAYRVAVTHDNKTATLVVDADTGEVILNPPLSTRLSAR